VMVRRLIEGIDLSVENERGGRGWLGVDGRDA
jgi:hypothetical protein